MNLARRKFLHLAPVLLHSRVSHTVPWPSTIQAAR